MKFEGEHLLAGQIGQISVYTAFTFSLVAAIGFLFLLSQKIPKLKNPGDSWLAQHFLFMQPL